jgi:hypothetical protein
MLSSDPVSPAPPVPPAAAQRGYRHWTIIGVVVAALILVFLLRR